jgi:SAM-dependent MidA family methyltransferase
MENTAHEPEAMNQDLTHHLADAGSPVLSLPEPGSEAIQHSQRLVEHIHTCIETQDGFLSFADYMEQVLYAPGLGYYSAGSRKLGQDGDFITAPEISPLFSRCLANALQGVLTPDSQLQGNILEVGAGTGIMAATILLQLESSRSLPGQYLILERSAELRERQQQTLQQHCPHLLGRVSWLDDLPHGFNGVVIANELLDALPVHRVTRQHGQWQELGVTFNGQFSYATREITQPRLQQRLRMIESELGELPEGYTTEINLAAEDWIHSLASCLEQGMVLLIDYGYSQHEYFHPQRQQGTLMCHYRHRAHDDPFVYPGLQDITAHVDFTAMADAALDAGLKVRGYTAQALFLMDNGLNELAETVAAQDAEQQLRLATEIRRLTLPQEMGESFKVILFSKNTDEMLPGFAMDMRERL